MELTEKHEHLNVAMESRDETSSVLQDLIDRCLSLVFQKTFHCLSLVFPLPFHCLSSLNRCLSLAPSPVFDAVDDQQRAAAAREGRAAAEGGRAEHCS